MPELSPRSSLRPKRQWLTAAPTIVSTAATRQKRELQASIEKLKPEDLKLLKAANQVLIPRIAAFDGNGESTLVSITRFIVETMGSVFRFKKRDFNFRAPTAARYRRMTTKSSPMRTSIGLGRDLTVLQILELMELDQLGVNGPRPVRKKARATEVALEPTAR